MSQTTKRRMRVLAIASAAATVGLVWLVVKAWGVHASWAVAALENPVGRLALLWFLGGMVVLGVLVAVMIRLQPEKLHGHPRVLHGDQDGTASVEFVLLMPIGLLIILIITQAALLFQANLVVNYSAYAAVREASVALSLDLPDEGGMCNLVNNPDYPLSGGSTKLDLIKRAACLALMPISGYCDSPPDSSSTGSSTDFTDPGGSGVAAAASGAVQSTDANNKSWQAMEDMYAYAKGSFGFVGAAEKKYNYAMKYTQINLAEPEHWRTGDPDLNCPYARSKNPQDYNDWNWDTGNFVYVVDGKTFVNGIPYCPYFSSQMDFYKWEELHVRVIYQFLLDVPYAGPLVGGTAAQVPGINHTAWQMEIRAIGNLMNEGGPDPKPKS